MVISLDSFPPTYPPFRHIISLPLQIAHSSTFALQATSTHRSFEKALHVSNNSYTEYHLAICAPAAELLLQAKRRAAGFKCRKTSTAVFGLVSIFMRFLRLGLVNDWLGWYTDQGFFNRSENLKN